MKTLRRDREIFVWGEIQESSSLLTIRRIRLLGRANKEKPISIFVHSDGGCLDSTLAIIDEIQYWQGQGAIIRTVCQGKAFSAAAIILAFGSKGERLATPGSSLMLHPVSYNLPEDYAGQQERQAAFISRQIESIYRRLAEACGKSGAKAYKKFRDEIEKTLWLSAAEAVKFGVIDGIYGQ